MNYKSAFVVVALLVLDAVLVIWLLTHGSTFAVLEPKGMIAMKERGLMITAVLLMLLVVIPVFILALYIPWKYRAGNTKAHYAPDWDHDSKLQAFWWGFPTVVITILAVITWTNTHTLDPHQALASTTKPITIQVVALQWKWLFIYPEQGIATVNVVAFPEKTPVNFELTAADTPMNSFWIPQLGGQMYAMSGMVIKLPLMADAPGEFRGSNAEISGQGFAGMTFTAKSLSQNDFDTWVASVKQSPQSLNHDGFTTLSKPSENNLPTYYSSTEDNLYTTILMKYTAHPSSDKAGSGQAKPNMDNMREMHDMQYKVPSGT